MGFENFYRSVRDQARTTFANPYRSIMLKIKRTKTVRSMEALMTYGTIYETLLLA